MEPKLTVSEHSDAHLVIGALRHALHNCLGNLANVDEAMTALYAQIDQLSAQRSESNGVARQLEALIAAAEKSHDTIVDRETLANEAPLAEWEKDLLNDANQAQMPFSGDDALTPENAKEALKEKLAQSAGYGKDEPKVIQQLRALGFTVMPITGAFFD